MHEYTEIVSKYTGEIGTHSMWEQMYIIKLKTYAKQNEAKQFFKSKIINILFMLIITVQIFSL